MLSTSRTVMMLLTSVLLFCYRPKFVETGANQWLNCALYCPLLADAPPCWWKGPTYTFEACWICICVQSFSFKMEKEMCKSCKKTVYPMEKLVANDLVFHSACFCCKHCNAKLRYKSHSSFPSPASSVWFDDHFLLSPQSWLLCCPSRWILLQAALSAAVQKQGQLRRGLWTQTAQRALERQGDGQHDEDGLMAAPRPCLFFLPAHHIFWASVKSSTRSPIDTCIDRPVIITTTEIIFWDLFFHLHLLCSYLFFLTVLLIGIWLWPKDLSSVGAEMIKSLF